MRSSLCLGVLAILCTASAHADTLTLEPIGLGYTDRGAGFIPIPDYVPGQSFPWVGQNLGIIVNGVLRSAWEYDLSAIPDFATINSAYLSLNPGDRDRRGRVLLSTYYGDGVMNSADVMHTAASYVLDQNTHYTEILLDVTNNFRSFWNIGAPFLGFTARQDPLGECRVPSLFGDCAVALTSVLTANSFPALVVDYTPLVPPPPPIPEPSTWTMLVLAGVAGFVRLRRSA